MNKKLVKLIQKEKNNLETGTILDCYNQVLVKEISCTITTRVNASNEIYVVEFINEKN